MWINEFVARLSDVNVSHEQFLELMALKNKRLPKRVYKYFRYNDYSLGNLQSDNVWMSCPEVYNDPYDCCFTVSYDAILGGELMAYATELITDHKNIAPLTPDQLDFIKGEQFPHLEVLRLMLSKLDKTAKPSEIYQDGKLSRIAQKIPAILRDHNEISRGILHDGRKSLTICSFSQVYKSIIMWSHYADNHRGFCLEYDIASIGQEEMTRQMLCPVIYSRTLFDATEFYRCMVAERRLPNFRFEILAALHKSPEWKYEREWRLVNMSESEGCWQMPTPRRLFLGARTGATEKAVLSSICIEKNIQVCQMNLKMNSFQLEYAPI